jgi:hypothetical protein
MTDSFKLHLPADPAYRKLVPELAARYAELAGGTSNDGATLAAAVTSAIERIAQEAGADGTVDLAFRANGQGVHVQLLCGSREESLNVPIAVAKS